MSSELDSQQCLVYISHNIFFLLGVVEKIFQICVYTLCIYIHKFVLLRITSALEASYMSRHTNSFKDF